MVAFLTGTGFLIALGIFILGMLHRVVWYVRGLNWKLDRVAYRPNLSHGLKGGIHSALKWLVPFATEGWRSAPLLTAATFIFHVSIILVGLFLAGHAVILRSVIGGSLPTLPAWLADTLTLLAIVALLVLILRRLLLPHVRVLTTSGDWFALLLTLLPLVSGFVAAHAGPEAEGAYVAHLITGTLFLVLAPFTRLSHLVLYFLSRAQIGMDFAIKRGGRSRGAFFPW